MPTINDRQLRTAYAKFESKARLDPNTKIDSGNMLKLLAAVGDTWFKGAASLEKALSKPGITRDEQVALVKNGMDSTEKADLAKILDTGKVAMTDEVKNFLNAVVGRPAVTPSTPVTPTTPVTPGTPSTPVTPTTPNDGALHITGSQAGGIIQGTVAAGTSIEAINLSTSPTKRLHTDDTFVLAKAGADGKFSGSVGDMKEGDIIRLRTRDAAGKAGNWMTVRASGLGGVDTRNAEVALFRVGLTDNKDGTVHVENINSSRQISEPGAQLQFINDRTNEKTVVTLNDEGTFAEALKLKGQGGDNFSVRVSDGTNNKTFSVELGKVSVPGGAGGTTGGVQLPDPALHKDELNADGTPKFSVKRFSGPLFVDGAKPEDVKQGQIGNCYMPAGVAAVASKFPDLLKDLIKDNGNGSYTVTFKERDWRTSSYKDKQVTVDADLYSRSWGGPLYGSSAGSTETTKMEMWWPILEKAFAQRDGSYNAIGNGGQASEVMESLVGRPSNSLSLAYSNETAVWNRIKTAMDAGLPACAGTFGEDQEAKYTNTGVYANHAYSILGTVEKNGEKFVTMRNPWGESEPSPSDGKNDGIFNIKLADFMKLYQTVYTLQ